jgi:cell wall-associated NlpC family hydrolase
MQTSATTPPGATIPPAASPSTTSATATPTTSTTAPSSTAPAASPSTAAATAAAAAAAKVAPRRKLTARYHPLRKISAGDVRAMHRLFAGFYENADEPTFLRDLMKKDGAIIVRDRATREIRGFTTVKKVPLWDGKRDAIGVFSGDTILDPSCWGDRALKDAFARYLLGLWIRSFGGPLYWLLISKGYKTYLLLAKNFVNYYPRHDAPDDPRLQRLVQAYSDKLFPGRYDKRRGILDFGDGCQRLRETVAPITPSMRLNDPVINYFERRNPGWREGHELPCVAEISISLLKPYLVKEQRKAVATREPS